MIPDKPWSGSQRQILITTQCKIAGGSEKEVNPDTFNKGVTQAL